MAAIYWVAAALLGLVLGLAAGVMLIVEYTGYFIGVGTMVIGSQLARALPRRRPAA